jgi:hypothetical protein
MKMKHLLIAAALLYAAPVSAATQIKCGSTYYVPLIQIDWAGRTSPLPSSAQLITSVSSGGVLSASIGTMPSSSAVATVLHPYKPQSGVTVTVSDNNSRDRLSPGSATFDIMTSGTASPARAQPGISAARHSQSQQIVLDVAHMASTAP